VPNLYVVRGVSATRLSAGKKAAATLWGDSKRTLFLCLPFLRFQVLAF
jgi:hypothetical protein